MNSILLVSSFLKNYNKTRIKPEDEDNINSVLDKYNSKKTNILNEFNLKEYKKNFESKQINNIEDITNTEFDPNNDVDREYKNLCTDIVNEDIIDNNDLYNFLYIINKTYTDIINIYLKKNNLREGQIEFIFKGGNIFKLISDQFWNYLPGQSSKILVEYYKKHFKRSDIDFSIYIDPSIENFDKYYEELTYINYEIQLLLIEILTHNKSICFSWFRYNPIYKQQILKKWLKKLQQTDGLVNYLNKKFYNKEIINLSLLEDSANNTSKDYIKKNNYIIEFNGQKKQFYDVENNNIFTYTSINKTLDFPPVKGKTNIHTSFHLIRSKINFNITMKDKTTKKHTKFSIGGELIDVSIIHKKDITLQHFFDNKKNYISKILWKEGYTNIYPNKVQSFSINCYSLNYIYKDVSKILFETEQFPWDTPKYEKRLYRLFYTCFVNLFDIKSTERTYITLRYIKRLYSYITSLVEILDNINNNENYDKNRLMLLLKHKEFFVNYITKLYHNSNNLFLMETLNICLEYYENILYTYNYINPTVDKSFKKYKISNTQYNVLDNLYNFIDIIKNNIKYLLDTLNNNKTYCGDKVEFKYNEYDTFII